MKNKFDNETIRSARKHSFLNKEELLRSETCGCYDCLRIFKPSEIKYWHYESQTSTGQKGYTAFCPFNCFDTVIGSASGYPITEEFLYAMKNQDTN